MTDKDAPPPAYEVAWDRTLKFARNAFANFGLTDEQLTEYARSIYDDLVAHLIPQPPPPASGEVGEMVEFLRSLDRSGWVASRETMRKAADLLAQFHAEANRAWEQKCRADRAEARLAKVEKERDWLTKPNSTLIRCDDCDNGIASDFRWCPWCGTLRIDEEMA